MIKLQGFEFGSDRCGEIGGCREGEGAHLSDTWRR